jgi:hypothetical protein
MQNSPDFQRDWAAGSLDAIGGEPLTGSGFETDEPELRRFTLTNHGKTCTFKGKQA